jgi:hypothetical protein
MAVEPTPELVDDIYREKVLRSRRMSPARRLEASLELSDMGLQMMRDSVRHQYPGASESEITARVNDRIELSRKLDNIPLPEINPHLADTNHVE